LYGFKQCLKKGAAMFNNKIRLAAVAGSFYPGNEGALSGMVKNFLKNAANEELPDITGLVSPHAGYVYSGQVAACSYKQVEGKKYKSIFIIAPSHSEYFDFNSVFDGRAYQTPLGIVEVDTERAERLTGIAAYKNNIRMSDSGHRREHSLEVQLPFLQTVFENFKIVPVVMGRQDKKNIESLGNAIGDTFKGEDILIIASTDLSHYHDYNTATALDDSVIDYINSFEAVRFADAVISDEVQMCGGGPVAAAMIAAKIFGANSSKILCYKNSGDTGGDRDAVVGYLSAAFYKK
jgi:AmmeMemoRadiSam system protein B